MARCYSERDIRGTLFSLIMRRHKAPPRFAEREFQALADCIPKRRRLLKASKRHPKNVREEIRRTLRRLAGVLRYLRVTRQL